MDYACYRGFFLLTKNFTQFSSNYFDYKNRFASSAEAMQAPLRQRLGTVWLFWHCYIPIISKLISQKLRLGLS